MSNRVHVSIKSYHQAMEFLGNKKDRPIAHNTRIENMEDVIKIRYHGNPIVVFYPDGSMSLSSCGWKTVTTKERINWSLPEEFMMYQESSIWYLAKRGRGRSEEHTSELQSQSNLVCRLLLEKKNKKKIENNDQK